MLELSFTNKTRSKKINKSFVSQTLEAAFACIKIKSQEVGISVIIVDEAEMTRLNSMRNKEGITDVLAFPLDDARGDDVIIELGDIFLFIPALEERSRLAGVSFRNYTQRMLIHGFLHLIGYDHDRGIKEYERMEGMEKLILGKLNSVSKVSSKQ